MIILVLFLWMVRTVIIAAILGVIVAMYMRPVYLWLLRRIRSPIAAASLTLALLIVPLFALTAYSYEEIADRATYVSHTSGRDRDQDRRVAAPTALSAERRTRWPPSGGT